MLEIIEAKDKTSAGHLNKHIVPEPHESSFLPANLAEVD